MNLKPRILLIASKSHDPAAIVDAFGTDAPGLLHIVQNGHEAMNYLDQVSQTAAGAELPDLLLLERQIPHAEGSQLLHWLRGRAPEALRQLPVVILDSLSRPAHAGAACFTNQ